VVDAATAQAILKNDPRKLLDVLSENKQKNIDNLLTSLCGWTSVLTLLYMTANNPRYTYHTVDYRNSGDEKLYGDRNQVVGYWSIVVTESPSSEKEEFYLTDNDKKHCLRKRAAPLKIFYWEEKFRNPI